MDDFTFVAYVLLNYKGTLTSWYEKGNYKCHFYINEFLNDMNILHVLYWQLPIEVNCFIITLYFLHLYVNFMPLYINDSAA